MFKFFGGAGRWSVLLAAFLAAASCAGPGNGLNFDYQVNRAVMSAGPPQPAGLGIASAAEIASDLDVKIDASTAKGYENLPVEMQRLYGDAPRQVALQDIVHQLLANNRDIKIEGYALQVAEYQIPLEKGIYDLLIEASGSANKSKAQTRQSVSTGGGGGGSASAGIPGFVIPPDLPPETQELLATLLPILNANVAGLVNSFFGGSGSGGGIVPVNVRRERAIDASVTQLLPTGARLQLAYGYSRVRSDPSFNQINPLLSHTVSVSLTQPLLQGFGPSITNVDIRIAQEGLKVSAGQFEIQVQNQLSQALTAYWDLIQAVHTYEVQVISYVAARELFRVQTVKVEVGALARTEALQAKAAAEQRREQVILARRDVRDAEDLLKQLMFFQPERPAWDIEVFPTQELSWREIEIDAAQLLTEALTERPEIRVRESLLSQRDLDTLKARDALKPRLDFVGVAGASGIASAGSDAFDNLGTLDFNNFSIGLEFSFPLQNRRARYAHKQTRALMSSAIEELEKTRDQVVFDVRVAIRAVRTASQVIEVSRSRVESEQANLDAEQKKFEAGISTQFQVLDFQEDLAAAQQSYVQAVVAYNKATIALELARGSILNSYGVQIANPSLRPANEKIGFPIGFK